MDMLKEMVKEVLLEILNEEQHSVKPGFKKRSRYRSSHKSQSMFHDLIKKIYYSGALGPGYTPHARRTRVINDPSIQQVVKAP